MANAAPEWQARSVKLEKDTIGGLSTRGACSKRRLNHLMVCSVAIKSLAVMKAAYGLCGIYLPASECGEKKSGGHKIVRLL